MTFREWELTFLQWLSEYRTEWANGFISTINFTGDVLFFTILLPIIYWLFSKKVGFRMAIVIFISFYTNVLLKDIFQIPRPFHASTSIEPLFEQHGNSFPSGHAQHSMSFWGFLAVTLQRTSFWLLAVVMIILVGFARMYSGVHYPIDVIGGWIAGIIVITGLGIAFRSGFFKRISNAVVIILTVVGVLLAILLYESLAEGVLDREGAYQACGLFLFAVLGYIWERQSIRFVISHSWLKRIAALIIGLTGLLLIKEGVKLILPEHVWSDFLRYGLMAFWTIALAPYLFVKVKLYSKMMKTKR